MQENATPAKACFYKGDCGNAVPFPYAHKQRQHSTHKPKQALTSNACPTPSEPSRRDIDEGAAAQAAVSQRCSEKAEKASGFPEKQKKQMVFSKIRQLKANKLKCSGKRHSAAPFVFCQIKRQKARHKKRDAPLPKIAKVRPFCVGAVRPPPIGAEDTAPT